MNKENIEKEFLDIIIENFDKNSKSWDLYSKEEVIEFLNKLYKLPLLTQ